MMSHIEMEYAKTLKQVSQLERELAAEKEWIRQSTNSNARLEKFLAEAQAEIVRLKGEIDELRAALAEPAQEPMHPEIKKMYEDYFDKCFRELSAQQRPWVGLTEDEITKLHHEIKTQLMGTYKTEDIYRAIETKLREKNHD